MSSDTFRIIALPEGLKPRRGLVWFWLVLFSVAPMLPLTDFVGHPHWDAVRWVPFQDFSFSGGILQDVIGNTVWFIIVGYLLHCLVYDRTRHHLGSLEGILSIILIAAGLSLSLETFQIFCHNRVPSITDVTCNVIGAGIGAYLASRQCLMQACEPVRYLVVEDNGKRTLL